MVRDEGPLPVSRAVDYILDMIDGLIAAHHVGVIHRDLKPSNCFIDEDGRVKIGDYGLSKSVIGGNASLTQTGAFMGTPQFAAPEQIKSGDLDERTDIYAVGCTLFYLLTGQAPFSGNAAQVIASIASDRAPRLISLDTNIPRDLDRIVAQTLEKDPGKRPEHLLELREALLPFSSSGASMANVGRRLAAFFADVAVAMLVANIIGTFITFFVMFSPGSWNDGDRFAYSQVITATCQIFGVVVYFTVAESRYGTTLGKWLMGLRVIRNNSERPTLFQAFIRSLLLPGSSLIVSLFPPIIWNFLSEYQVEDGLYEFIMRSQLFTLLSWIPLGLCLMTMRASNSLRGLHEILTGTRTVELAGALAEKRLDRVPVTVAALVELPESNERFVRDGKLGYGLTLSSEVFFGRDSGLDREVWLYSNFGLASEDPEAQQHREELSRPGRLRLLHTSQGEEDLCVFEAIRGAPLLHSLRTRRNLQWQMVRGILCDLANELVHAIDDGTLPDGLHPEQVWVNEAGEMKLLDAPILSNSFVQTNDSDSEDNRSIDGEGKSVTLLQTLLSELVAGSVVPGHIVDFHQKLMVSDKNLETLQWCCEELRDSSDRPSKWSWDDRVAVMASTMGIELFTLSSLSFGIVILMRMFSGLSSYALIGVVSACFYGLAVFLGFHFRGGPVFHLSGIEVRRTDWKRASKLRCGIRSAIAWAPLAILNYAMMVQVSFGDQSTISAEAVVIFLVLLLGVFGAVLFTLLGVAVSVLNSRRGLQDFLSGTVLMRE